MEGQRQNSIPPNIVCGGIIRLDILCECESSARQMIHMKHKALFSSRGKTRKKLCRLVQF